MYPPVHAQSNPDKAAIICMVMHRVGATAVGREGKVSLSDAVCYREGISTTPNCYLENGRDDAYPGNV